MSEIAATEPVTQLDFQEAMRDFKFMFPEMDSDVIEAVLRANHGAVDATIDQLLTMNTDYENEKVRHPSLGSAAVETAPPSYNQVADQPADESLIRPDPVRNKNVLAPLFGCQRILGVPLCSSRGWKPALLRPLPADFLRVERHRSSPRHADLLPSGRLMLQRMEERTKQNTEPQNQQQQPQQQHQQQQQQEQQVLDDERLAMMLQNAEFVQALRGDQDFMDSLTTAEQQTRRAAETAQAQSSAAGASDLRPVDDEAAFRERLRQMGKVPRRKLTQLARQFFRGKKILFNPMANSAAKDRSILCDQDEDDESSQPGAESRSTDPSHQTRSHYP